MVALKMDGTVRQKRQPKRATRELPFWMEMAFSRGYLEGLAYYEGRKPEAPCYDTSPMTQAGFAVGRRGATKQEAFKALQEFIAPHGFHRD